MSIKSFFEREGFLLLLFLIFLITSLSAVTYLSSEGVFDAKITYVNNVKLPYSVILSVEGLVDQKINYEIEVIYDKLNLVVSSETIDCIGKCEVKLPLRKIFFDEYSIVIRSRINGKFYEKLIYFDLQKPQTGNDVKLDSNSYFIVSNGTSVNISGELETEFPSVIMLEIYPTRDSSIKTTKKVFCEDICDFFIEVNNTILLDNYSLNAYFKNDVINKNFEIQYLDIEKDTNSNTISINKTNGNKKNMGVDDLLINSQILKKKNFMKNDLEKLTANKSLNLDQKLFGKLENDFLQSRSSGRSSKINIQANTLGVGPKKNTKKIAEYKLDDTIVIRDLTLDELKNYTPSNGTTSVYVYDDLTDVVNKDISIPTETELVQIDDETMKNLSSVMNLKKISKGQNYDNYSLQNDLVKKKAIPGIYVVEDSLGNKNYFAYGLISINTKKPLYQKGDMVEFVIVVLDKNGYLYSDADIVLNIVKPDGLIEVLSTINGSIVESFEKEGVYFGYFEAEDEGEYSLFAQTRVDGIIVDVESYFNVVLDYPFDIIRDVPATIDPWQGPFLNNFSIATRDLNLAEFNFYEVIPSDFTVYENNADDVLYNENNITFIWRNIDDSFNPYYIANSPLITPYLYELGKSWIEYSDSNSLFYENRSWLFAIDPMAPSRDPTQRTCSDTFGNNCNGGGSGVFDDAFDLCDGSEVADGTNYWEYVGEARVNTTQAFPGDTVLATCEFYADCGNNGGSADEYYIYYHDGNSWTQLRAGIMNGCSDMTLATRTTTFTVGNNPGEHHVRCIINWQGQGTSCANGGSNYYDNDDVSFNVSGPVAPTSNFSDIDFGNGANIVRGASGNAYAFWNYTSGINSAFLEHDGTSTPVNYSVSSLSDYWTNYSFDTSDQTRFSKNGRIEMVFYAEDEGIYGPSQNLWFFLYDFANLSSISITPNPVDEGNLVNISCVSYNEFLGIPAENVRVNFYDNVTGFLGFSKTNNLGVASILSSYSTPGNYQLSCSIVDTLSSYYYASISQNNLSASLNVLDKSSPLISLVAPLNGSQDIDGDIDFEFNVNDQFSSISNCSLYIDGSIVLTDDSILEGSVNILNSILLNGDHQWSVGCYDDSSNNNFGYSENWSITVAPDTQGPVIELLSPPNNSQDPDGIVDFSFRAYDELVGISECSLYLNGIINQTNNSILENVTTTFHVTGLITGNNYNWSIGCSDNFVSNNFNMSQTRDLLVDIDTTPPVINILSPLNNSKDTDGNITIEYLAQDYAYNVSSCSLYINGVLNQTNNSINELSSNFFQINNALEGNDNFYINCIDSSPLSNSVNSDFVNFLVDYDFLSPFVSLILPKNNSQDVDGDVVFYYNVSDENPIDHCSLYINDLFTLTNNTINRNMIQNFSVNSIPNGYYNWSVRCEDSSDGTYVGYSNHFNLNISPDTVGPQINILSPLNNSYDADGKIYFRFVAIDEVSGIDYCSLYVNGILAATDNSIVNGEENIFNFTYTNGNYNWYLECVDNSILANTQISDMRYFNIDISYDTMTNVTIGKSEIIIGEDINSTGFAGDKYGSPLDNANLTFYLIENLGVSNATLPWWDLSWLNRREFQVEELSGTTLTDTVVNFALDTASLISSGDMKVDCSDLRFADYDGNLYDYWIKSGCNSASTDIYLRLKDITGGKNTTFGMYYSNPSALAVSSKSQVLPLYDRFETASIDNSIWTVTNSGCTTPWFSQTGTVYEGSRSVQGGVCEDNDETFMDATFTVSNTEVLSFYWKVSSESGYDFLAFCLDVPLADCNSASDISAGRATSSISGNVDWQLKTYVLSPGTHTIRFIYAKDNSVSSLSDTGWVDFVSVPENIDFSITDFNSLTSEMVFVENSSIKNTNYAGFSNWIYDSSSSALGDYSITILDRKTGFFSNYNYTTFSIIPDIYPPLVEYAFPTLTNNSVISQNWTLINVTVNEVNLNQVLLELNGTNYTMSCLGNKPDYSCYYNFSFSNEGNFSYKVYARDNYGNLNVTSQRNIVFDLNSPIMSYLFPTPLNNSFSLIDSVNINFSLVDFSLDDTWVIFNGIRQAPNCVSILSSSYLCNLSQTNLLDGEYSFRACANDSLSRETCLENRIVKIDSAYPQINYANPTPLNNSYIFNNWVYVNVTVNEYYLDDVILEFGGINHTMNCIGSSPNYSCNYNISGLSDGLYLYKIYVNDSVGHLNMTLERRVTIDANPPVLNYVYPSDLNNSYVNRSSFLVNLTTTDISNTSTFINFENGLLLYWNFEDFDGMTVLDKSGNTRNGIVSNSVIPLTGGIRGGYGDFSGNDLDQIDRSSTFLNWRKALTVSVWVKADAIGTDKGIFRFSNFIGTDDFNLRYDAQGWGGGGTNVIKAAVNTQSGGTQVESSSNVQTTNWQHIVITWKAGESIKLYINGVLDTLTHDAGPASGGLVTGGILTLGDSQKDENWNGSIDEFMIFSRELSSSEILSLYDSQSNQYENNFTQLKNGLYTYKGCAIDSAGNYNCTSDRFININKTLPKILVLHPLDNSKFGYDQRIDLNISTDLPTNGSWFEVDLNGTFYDMNYFNSSNWYSFIENLSGGYHNVYFFVNDSVGNIANNSVDFYIIPEKHVLVEKTFRNVGENLYNISINMKNLGKWDQYSLIDSIKSSSSSNYSISPNLSYSISSKDLFIWNFTMANSESKNVSYLLNFSDNFVFGGMQIASD